MPDRYLLLHGVAHIPDAETPATALCGWGGWEKDLHGTPCGLSACSPCLEIADFEGYPYWPRTVQNEAGQP